MDEIMQCSVCYLNYDTESHKPCIGKCGHTICFLCANDERCEACPVCKRDGSFQDVVVNIGLMNIIEFKNKKKQAVEGICNLCKKEARKPLICIDCNLNKGILRKHSSKSKNEDEIGVKWNTENRSLAECIKKAEMSSFCADCSVSSVHNRHHIGSFKYIQQKIFSNEMIGIKGEIEGFLNSFDNLKEGIVHKLDEYRKKVTSLLYYVAQTIEQLTNYPKRVMEFIEKSKVVLKGLTSCHLSITNSIGEIDNMLDANAQSNRTTEKEEIIHHLTHIHNNDRELGKLEIYAYNTISNKMKMETEVSVPYCCTSILHKNNVYILGGLNNITALKTVEVYNLNDKSWRMLPDMNEGRFCPTVCIHNGKIVVCGGYNDGFVNSLEEYDFEKNKWKIIGRLDDDSDYYRIVSHENDLYGVCINENDTITIKKFNKKKSVFETVHRTTSFSSAHIHGCTSFNGKIYMIGRFYYCHYDPTTNKLSNHFVMSEEEDVRLHSLNNQLYAIDWKSVEVFDEKNYKWNRLWSKY